MPRGGGDRRVPGGKERTGVSDHLFQPGLELTGQKDTLTIVPEMVRGHADACPLNLLLISYFLKKGFLAFFSPSHHIFIAFFILYLAVNPIEFLDQIIIVF